MDGLRRLLGKQDSTSKKSSGPLDPHQAEELWQEAFNLFRSDKKKDHLKAIEIALRLIADGPTDAVTKSKLQCFIADIYTQNLGQHDRAIEYYEEALKTDPGNSLAGSNLGFVYLHYKKDYKSAVNVLQQTLDHGISSAFIRESTRDWLAEAKQKLGR
jgi:tetratricopeptide (TPR) repeat protein